MTIFFSKPILSIIIPTRNRSNYLIHSIGSILKIIDFDFELVIHDTSDNEDFGKLLSLKYQDKRLRYFYTKPPLSFSETFNKSVALSNGEYVCIIGDDDGVNPEIVHAAKWAKKQSIDALTPTLNTFYWWPDFKLKYYKNNDSSHLKIKPFTGKYILLNAQSELILSAKNAFQDFSKLPKIYNGLIKRSCLDNVFNRTGSFFFGSSPDISGALTAATFVKSFCLLDYPLIIVGSSANSGSGKSAMKKHVGSLEGDPQTKAFATNWPKEIPSFYSVQTVWAQSAVIGLTSIGRFDILKSFNAPLLHAQCFTYNPRYFALIFCNLIKLKSGSILVNILYFIYYTILTWSKRIISHILRISNIGYFKYLFSDNDINNIEIASDKFSDFMKNYDIKFPK